jgi:hypothetical protein
MVEGATLEDIRSGEGEIIPEKSYLDPSVEGLTQLEGNPLDKIDTKALMQRNEVMYKEKQISKRDYQLKRLFLLYIRNYADKWYSKITYPKQIKQKPAWFELALSKFKDSEISQDDKKKIKVGLNTLWEYRDRNLPERVMSEEESNRQYGIQSPYYEQPEAPIGQLPSYSEGSTEDILTQPQEGGYNQSSYSEPIIAPPLSDENPFGIRKVSPSGDTSLAKYIIPARRTIGITPSAASPTSLKPPQGDFVMGITKSEKESGGSGSGAFSIGKSMFAGLRGKDSLQGIINQRKPNLPVQPMQVKPDETITVAQQPTVMQRKSKKSVATIDRKKIGTMPKGLSKFRNIELPTIPKTKMPKISTSTKNKQSTLKISTGKSGLNIKSGKINTSFKVDKNSVASMSHDVRKSVGGVVGGIKNLKKQVRGEFKGGKSLKAINLKNIKSQKFKDHKDMNVLNELKRQTRSQLSHEALECKMVPKLKAQCDKVFTKNNITSEVKKFRDEFKDINKMVPTVKGDKAKLTEVAMLGRSINHGVDGVHVNDIRDMYQKSGTTKQMNIGRMEYDYSFITGKKRPKLPAITDDVYEEEY